MFCQIESDRFKRFKDQHFRFKLYKIVFIEQDFGAKNELVKRRLKTTQASLPDHSEIWYYDNMSTCIIIGDAF